MVSLTLSSLFGSEKARHGGALSETGEKLSCWPKKIEGEVERPKNFYPEDIETIRKREFPLLKDTTYLDHGGATLYAKSLIGDFSRELVSNLFGNPHSASASSQLSTQRVDDARLKLLHFFNADPDEFDIVFVANATAAIKLVTEALRDYDDRGFWYGYHVDSHTSLVGPRNVALQGSRCFANGDEVEEWIASLDTQLDADAHPKLLSYPAQSNMTGSRLGFKWFRAIREKTNGRGNVFTLCDAAAYVSSSPLDLSDPASAPDFTALSLYKIFGFPDLGVLIVRKSAGHIFEKRRYFGGGTVGMVVSLGNEWHAKKDGAIHDGLEDGTLPFHNIVAVHCAIDVHKRLYGSMDNVARHTAALAKSLYSRLDAMRHFNGAKVCEIYKSSWSTYGDPATQGPVIAFNLKDSRGMWVGKSDVEKLAAVKNIHIRSGGLCNPGGIASHLQLTFEDMMRNFAEGLRCGDENDIMGGKPSGTIRVSLGAMSSIQDIDTFVDFISEFYVEKDSYWRLFESSTTLDTAQAEFYIEKLCVYPIKSCGAFVIAGGQEWEVRPEGLAWDREWCLIHLGTNKALSQKKYPKMALIRPVVDLKKGVLRVTCRTAGDRDSNFVEVSLYHDDLEDHTATQLCKDSKLASVCGDNVTVQVYASPRMTQFFSDFLGVPCSLARFAQQSSVRHYQPKMPSSKPNKRLGILPSTFSQAIRPPSRNRVSLSNESPMLLVSRSSINRLNDEIKARRRPGKSVPSDVFRANIIVAENQPLRKMNKRNPGYLREHPYLEDLWSSFQVGNQRFDVLSSCQRCQMVCIDQDTGARSGEPYSTLAKTRKVNGKVYFGRHVSLTGTSFAGDGSRPSVRVGDRVVPVYGDI
ncbi:molybdenum cofactor sulfurase family protein [Emydomyces testavorans]|uniref:Molybdenum cofactor sulfurase n=1 Tax=Emydomyces testavorans TaxID=2070801 RepID=A0AAF0DJR7_9EURO|nr:molybdenum cofactor sulfurase family protein [Emydomyces testavorans]